MASAINPDLFDTPTPSLTDLRGTLAAAKAEIESLQAALASSQGPALPNAGYVSGRYYFGGLVAPGSAVAAMNLPDRAYCYPICIGSPVHITRLGAEVLTAAAGGVRVGLYSHVNGIPGDLLLDAGVLDTTTTGSKEAVVDITLAPGFYEVAVEVGSSSIGLRQAVAQAQLMAHVRGAASSANNQAYFAMESYFGGNTPLPATFVVTDTWLLGNTPPLVFFRSV